MRGRTGWLLVLAALGTAATLTACGLSWPAGIAGGLFATLLLVSALGLGVAQIGCQSRSTPVDSTAKPCLKVDARVGVCLGAMFPDGGKDTKVTPCLGALPADAGPDSRVGPCLKIAPPDIGNDVHLGPCLDIAPTDAAPLGAADPAPPWPGPPPAVEEREALLAKLSARLPADVAARLAKRG